MHRIAAALALPLIAFLLAAPAGAAGADDGKIVYQRFYKGGSEIFSFNPANDRSKRLTSESIRSGDNIAAGDPAYSPNRRRIVFTNAVKTPGSRGRRNNLFVMRGDGSRARRLTRSESHQSSPVFSPDGSTIAYGQRGDIHLIDRNGDNHRNLTADLPGGGYGGSFSPDGSSIAFATLDGGDSDIVVMNLETAAVVNVTASSADDEYSPDYSPDGTRLAFVSDRVDFHGDIYVMDADGSNVAPVTSDPGVEHEEPSFSPDGTALAYASRMDPSAAIRVFTIDVDGSARRQLPRTGGVSGSPDWG